MRMRYFKLSEYASAPSTHSEHSAGYDLASAYDYIVPTKGKCLIKTDLVFEIPSGCYARIAPRSGLAKKHFIDVGAGVVDSDYRDNVCILLFNFGESDFKVKRGDRIAQMILEKIEKFDLDETKENIQNRKRKCMDC